MNEHLSVVLRCAVTLRGMPSREDLVFEAVVRRIATGPYFDGLSAGPPAPLRPAPPAAVACMFPQHMTVVDWFSKWAEGTLHQPWLVQDPMTGVWRGATDAEYAELLEDAFGPGGPAD
jgi:hypothetical protein